MELTIVRKVTVNLTADEWQIFSDMPGANRAAAEMSKLASKALSSANKEEAIELFSEGKSKWIEYGSCDTEPRWVFADLADEVFGS
jgi:hypothetical protein